MMTSPSAPWRRLICISPEGRREALWVEPSGNSTYRVLNPPVWAYGVSIGSLVRAAEAPDGYLSLEEVVAPSEGGTVRVVAPEGVLASDVYLKSIVPGAKERSLYVGPATFYNPRLAAIHVRNRGQWWPEVGEFLDALVRDGVIEQWEVADPDVYAADSPQQTAQEPGQILLHQLPADGSDTEGFN